MRNKLIFSIVFILFLFQADSVLAEKTVAQGPPQTGTTIYLPIIQRSLPLPPADEASQRIQLPPGFAIRIYAQNIPGNPRFMTVGPDGQLYISLFGSGQIARLPDRNADGLADSIEIIASGLNGPHGIEFHGGYLYIASTDRVDRLPGPDVNGAFGAPEIIVPEISGT